MCNALIMRRWVVVFVALTSVGAACSDGVAYSANGPRADTQYWSVTCRDASSCWGAVHEQCPARYVIDERDGQQVTNGAITNGTGAINSHSQQSWLFHCLRAPVE